MFDLKNVNYRVDGKSILEVVKLHIPKHKLTAIIGPNGSGKSTLLQLLTVQRHYQGQLLFQGRDMKSYSRSQLARKVAFLPQKCVFPPSLRGRELLACGRFPYQRFWHNQLSSKDKAVIARVSAELSLEKLLERRIESISGGERQRLAIGLALVQEAEVLVLDEPTTYLDIVHQLEVLNLLQKLNRERKLTIVAVLHDLNQVQAYADYVIGLKAGQIIFQGKAEDVLTAEILHDLFGVEMTTYIATSGQYEVLLPQVPYSPCL